MIISDVRITGIEDVERRLGSLKDKAPVAMYRAVNDSVSKSFTETKKAISANYHITQKNIAPSLKKLKASRSNLKGAVSAKGERISLYKFKHKGGNPISAAVKKSNSPKPLDGNPKAFIAVMKNANGGNHNGIFERKGLYKKKRKTTEYGRRVKINKHNEQIRELDGPAIPQMMNDKKTMERIKNMASETMQRRLEHHIQRILQG